MIELKGDQVIKTEKGVFVEVEIKNANFYIANVWQRFNKNLDMTKDEFRKIADTQVETLLFSLWVVEYE